MKIKESRFQVHDELTAPERSVPVLKGALSGGGRRRTSSACSAGLPRRFAATRVPVRASQRLAPWATQQRIALGVAEHQGSEYALATLQRTGREAGLGIDEIALAREFDSRDEHEAVLLRFAKALVTADTPPPLHFLEEAREAGWTDEQILEAVANVGLASFSNLLTGPPNFPGTAHRRARASAGCVGRSPEVRLRW